MTVVVTEPVIDWGYEWRVIRWRRFHVSRAARWGLRVGITWCYPCQRMVFTFQIGKFYGSVNCFDARYAALPPDAPFETESGDWPDWIGSDSDFFDEFTVIDETKI